MWVNEPLINASIRSRTCRLNLYAFTSCYIRHNWANALKLINRRHFHVTQKRRSTTMDIDMRKETHEGRATIVSRKIIEIIDNKTHRDVPNSNCNGRSGKEENKEVTVYPQVRY